jgi:hypothetical protein
MERWRSGRFKAESWKFTGIVTWVKTLSHCNLGKNFVTL